MHTHTYTDAHKHTHTHAHAYTQVLNVDQNKNEVEVQLVPRVDMSDYADMEESEVKKRKSRNIPQRRVFEPSQYK